MVESVDGDGTGLTELTQLSLRRLAEVDDARLEHVVDRLVTPCGTGDRLWQIGNSRQGAPE